RFSPTQFYEFLSNAKVSQKNKDIFANRSSKLLADADEYKSEAVYAKLYTSDSFVSNIEKVLLKPYFEIRKFAVKLKEKGTLYKQLVVLSSQKDKKPEPKQPIDWKMEKEKA
ncbi:D-alanyl-lipoteichoic acid biosynthesis protein DltD, partial [Terrisporobacter hibernicus]